MHVSFNALILNTLQKINQRGIYLLLSPVWILFLLYSYTLIMTDGNNLLSLSEFCEWKKHVFPGFNLPLSN